MAINTVFTDSYTNPGGGGIDRIFSAPFEGQGPTVEAERARPWQERGKSYDITNTYGWTSVPTGSDYRKEAPSALVTAYMLDYGQLQQMIDGYINIFTAGQRAQTQGTDPGMEFYKNLYKPKGDPIAHFNFPFFSDDIRGFTSEYMDTFSPISQRGAKFLGAKPIEGLAGFGERMIGGATALTNEFANMGGNAVSNKVAEVTKGVGDWTKDKVEKGMGMLGVDMNKAPGLQTVGAPGNYIETPMFYQYSNTDAPLDISFVLSNTIDGPEGYLKNQEFITEFTKMNRPRRLGAIGMTFPAIYHIEVPGLRYIEWAFLQNFSVGLLGTRRKVETSNGTMILPEAFRCGFTFKSLTVEAANFMDQVDNVAPYDTSDEGYRALRARADATRRATQAELEEIQSRTPVETTAVETTEGYTDERLEVRPSGETVPTRAPEASPTSRTPDIVPTFSNNPNAGPEDINL